MERLFDLVHDYLATNSQIDEVAVVGALSHDYAATGGKGLLNWMDEPPWHRQGRGAKPDAQVTPLRHASHLADVK